MMAIKIKTHKCHFEGKGEGQHLSHWSTLLGLAYADAFDTVIAVFSI